MSRRSLCHVEEALEQHPVGASVFTPFLITRLRGVEQKAQARFLVRLQDIGTEGERQRAFRLTWDTRSVPARPSAIQEKTITEWAACGMACIVAARYAGPRVRSVAADGDRFDYWISDGEQEYGLEVSGTMTESFEEMRARHQRKRRQLLANPYGVDGYVVVIGFVTRQVIFSYHRFEEREG